MGIFGKAKAIRGGLGELVSMLPVWMEPHVFKDSGIIWMEVHVSPEDVVRARRASTTAGRFGSIRRIDIGFTLIGIAQTRGQAGHDRLDGLVVHRLENVTKSLPIHTVVGLLALLAPA